MSLDGIDEVGDRASEGQDAGCMGKVCSRIFGRDRPRGLKIKIGSDKMMTEIKGLPKCD
jgi:hypothetical protein